jgi:hypothetical protein
MANGHYTVDQLNSREFEDGRAQRTGVSQENTKFVVWVEFADGMLEMDVDSKSSALSLAAEWLEVFEGAMSASVRRVYPSGATRCVNVVKPCV